MNRFSWVTFDCYGTLIDWDSGIQSFLSDLLKRKGISVDLESLHQRWEAIQFDLIQKEYRTYKDILRLSLEAALNEFGVPYEPKDGDDFAASMPTWRPFPDVPSTLQELKRYVRIAIISNTDNDILFESVRLMGVEFNALVTAEDAKVYKPNQKIFEFALQKLGEPPGRILHVAFGFKYDISPAKQVGMATCWLNRKGEQTPEGVSADFILSDFTKLPQLVAGQSVAS
ncbi:MAG: haloacid dehalogenase type II [Candidatus Fervidibacter sp.]|uniref:haloacid dehalogenase type II n=1 Tax=Candidatus Fervidibacter sp. TaxID=3100871 RepID=UPI00404B8E8B